MLICQAKIAGAKRNLFAAAYNSTTHRFWRIRHERATGNVVFETASDLTSGWVVRYSERWDTGSVPLSSVLFEVKAGTWQVETAAPGTAIFDNFKAAVP